MKKLIAGILLATTLLSTAAVADEGHRWHGERHEYHGNGLAFLGGLLVGSIITHEVDGHVYDDQHRELVRVNQCYYQYVKDRWGNVMYDVYAKPVYREICYDVWKPVNSDTTIIIEQPPQ